MNDDIDDDPDADNTGEKLGNRPGTFRPGAAWSGNASGRPKGSRNKLSEEFLSEVLEAWRERGRAALTAAAQEKPVEFCKMVASLLPKQIQLKDELSDLTDEQLAALSALVARIIEDTEGEEQEAGKGTLQ